MAAYKQWNIFIWWRKKWQLLINTKFTCDQQKIDLILIKKENF